jgi:hypothetical protein
VHGLRTAEIGNQAYAAGVALHELTAHAGSLEDLFLGWTGDGDRRVERAVREVVPV